MSAKRYKVGFRVETNSVLDLLWDGGELVSATDYDAAMARIAALEAILNDIEAIAQSGESDIRAIGKALDRFVAREALAK